MLPCIGARLVENQVWVECICLFDGAVQPGLKVKGIFLFFVTIEVLA